MVCERLGGAVEYDGYEYFDLTGEIGRLMESRGSRVLPFGALRRGSSRHRAILYKALADRVGISVGLETSRCLRGAHANHSWNMFIDQGTVAVIDVLHAPGSLYTEGSDEAMRYKRVEQYAFASLTSTHRAYTKPSNRAVTVK